MKNILCFNLYELFSSLQYHIESLTLSLCCLVTPGLCKDIQHQVCSLFYDYRSPNHSSDSNYNGQSVCWLDWMQIAISTFLRGLCKYVWANILSLRITADSLLYISESSFQWKFNCSYVGLLCKVEDTRQTNKTQTAPIMLLSLVISASITRKTFCPLAFWTSFLCCNNIQTSVWFCI